MLRILPPTFKPVLQQMRLRKLVAETREYFYSLQQNLYMSRVLPAQDKLVLPQVTQIRSVMRDSRVILSNQKSWVFTQFATTWFVARQVSKSVGGKKTSLQQFCKTSFGYPFYRMRIKIIFTLMTL